MGRWVSGGCQGNTTVHEHAAKAAHWQAWAQCCVHAHLLAALAHAETNSQSLSPSMPSALTRPTHRLQTSAPGATPLAAPARGLGRAE